MIEVTDINKKTRKNLLNLSEKLDLRTISEEDLPKLKIEMNYEFDPIIKINSWPKKRKLKEDEKPEGQKKRVFKNARLVKKEKDQLTFLGRKTFTNSKNKIVKSKGYYYFIYYLENNK
jgi:hypothetical protein